MDFDGTLAPIVDTPFEAMLVAETRALLRRLAVCSGVQVAIVSGRRLADLREQVGVAGLFYAGNHGAEISGPGMDVLEELTAETVRELAQANAFLKAGTEVLDGVMVENKGLNIAVHWRLAPQRHRDALAELMHRALAAFPSLRLAGGKCVWELRPRKSWNKGDALALLASRLELGLDRVIYIGDDATDEDAFHAVDNELTFHVGGLGDATAARYQLRDPADVQAFLLCVLGVRSKVR